MPSSNQQTRNETRLYLHCLTKVHQHNCKRHTARRCCYISLSMQCAFIFKQQQEQKRKKKRMNEWEKKASFLVRYKIQKRSSLPSRPPTTHRVYCCILCRSSSGHTQRESREEEESPIEDGGIWFVLRPHTKEGRKQGRNSAESHKTLSLSLLFLFASSLPLWLN